jgi:hypothetical protein
MLDLVVLADYQCVVLCLVKVLFLAVLATRLLGEFGFVERGEEFGFGLSLSNEGVEVWGTCLSSESFRKLSTLVFEGAFVLLFTDD